MKKLLAACAMAPILSACGTSSAPAEEAGPQQADGLAARYDDLAPRLLGDWTDSVSEPGTVIHERWQRASDGSHTGMGFVMAGNDTIFIEHLGIARDSAGAVAYRVRVPSQHQGGTVSFALIRCIGDSMVFENPAHDFPQRIVYAWQPNGEWHARVSGPGKEGGWRVLRYRFKRAG